MTIQISRMWVLDKGLQSPRDYQISHMMNQVLLNYLIHLMLDISCYFVQQMIAASCESVPLSLTDFSLHRCENTTFQKHYKELRKVLIQFMQVVKLKMHKIDSLIANSISLVF